MESKYELVFKVIDQIKRDLENGEYDPLIELLYNLPESKLQGFLPEPGFDEVK